MKWAFLNSFHHRLPWMLLPMMLFVSGCSSRGPTHLTQDRMKYTMAMSTSWEQQLLLNIVRLQYAEAPTFLEVTNIVGSYEQNFGFAVGGDGSANSHNFVEENIRAGVDGRLIERPTITFSPLTGDKFTRQLMEPVPGPIVLSVIQAGWRADRVLGTFCRAINRVRNHFPRMDTITPEDPDFAQLLAVLQRLQDANALEFRTEPAERRTCMVIGGTAKETDMTKLRRLLNLKNSQTVFPIRFGVISADEEEIAFSTLSVMQVLLWLGEGIEYYGENHPILRVRNPGETRVSPMRIYSGNSRPENAYVAVQHDKQWFWVASDDPVSKSALMTICLVMKALESGDAQKPVLTIPTR